MQPDTELGACHTTASHPMHCDVQIGTRHITVSLTASVVTMCAAALRRSGMATP